MTVRVTDCGGGEGCPVIGQTGVEPTGDITPRESGRTSAGCLVTREPGKATEGAEQMAERRSVDDCETVETSATSGAALHKDDGWGQIDWARCERTVNRLQVRIVKATKEGRWGKVKALQHLLTHSFSGRAMAVKRVTENRGRRTPGIDGEIWSTPA